MKEHQTDEITSGLKQTAFLSQLGCILNLKNHLSIRYIGLKGKPLNALSVCVYIQHCRWMDTYKRTPDFHTRLIFPVPCQTSATFLQAPMPSGLPEPESNGLSPETSSLALCAAPHHRDLVFERLPLALVLAPGLPRLFQRLQCSITPANSRITSYSVRIR
jgi:hypothetical protein